MMLKHKRYDVRVRRAAGYRLEVYWRADELGCGPCMSVYVGKRERLRYDLFTPAHMHVGNIHGAPRDYYPPGLTIEQYVTLAVSDLSARYPQAQRAADWATEQLLKVTGPATASPRTTRRPASGRA